MDKRSIQRLGKKVLAAGANGVAISVADAEVLKAEGLVEVNPAGPNADGTILVRATAKLQGASATEAPAVESKPKFEIVSGLIPPPVTRGGGVREEIYPFSKLENGGTFAVPVPSKYSSPEEFLEKFTSTIASANRRFAEPIDGQTKTNRKGETVPVTRQTRKFVGRAVHAGQKYDNGFVEPADAVRVFRVL